MTKVKMSGEFANWYWIPIYRGEYGQQGNLWIGYNINVLTAFDLRLECSEK